MYTYTCKVLRVVDGDTLDLEIDLGFNVRIKERIRLYGINTPEIYGAAASERGKVASEFTKSWVDRFAIEQGYFRYDSLKYDYKDKYGRGLGTLVFVNTKTGKESSLVEELVQSGNTA